MNGINQSVTPSHSSRCLRYTCDNRATFQTSFCCQPREKKIRLNALIRQIKASCVLSRAYCKLFLTRLKAKIMGIITLK